MKDKIIYKIEDGNIEPYIITKETDLFFIIQHLFTRNEYSLMKNGDFFLSEKDAYRGLYDLKMKHRDALQKERDFIIDRINKMSIAINEISKKCF